MLRAGWGEGRLSFEGSWYCQLFPVLVFPGSALLPFSGFCAAEISGPSAWAKPLMLHFPLCTGVSRCVGILLDMQDMA